jgi:hypothetical protein
LNLTVKTAKKATPLLAGSAEAVFSINGLKGKNGVPFTYNYPGGKSNNINIRFKANILYCDNYSLACEEEYCPNNKGDAQCNTWCGANGTPLGCLNYCTVNGASDPINCHPEYCAANILDLAECRPEYCAAYGATTAIFSECPDEYCASKGTTIATFSECPDEYCARVNDEDPDCSDYCTTSVGEADFGECPDEFCVANPTDGNCL